MNKQPRERLQRALSLVMGGATLMAVLTGCALNPRVITFSGCAPAVEVAAGDLKQKSKTLELYYTPLTSEMIDQDARIFTALGATGFIFFWRFQNDDSPLANDALLRFTGVVYKRKASLPERLIGRVPDRLFYEVILSGKSVALHAGAFEQLPVPICASALDG